MGDSDLLRRFQQESTDEAFASLVDRHVDLVYSAAKRQVNSPDLARDVTQAVFLELAKNCRRLRPDTPLAAWLHVVTRRRSVDMIRSESRRRQREHQAWEESTATDAADASLWREIAPLLDEGVAALGETDRQAIILRFFENQRFRDIGTSLGVSEDTAQKRVTRALDRLRDFLSKKGVTTVTAGLGASLSAHAMAPAPQGLGGAIASSTAGIAAKGIAAHSAMTFGQKLVVGTLCATAVAVMVREAWAVHSEDEVIQSLTERSAHWNSWVLAAEGRAASTAKGAGQKEPDNLIADQNDPVRSIARRIGLLKDRLSTTPREYVPELAYLTDDSWILVASKHPKLESDDDFHRALAELRNRAVQSFEPRMAAALAAFVKASGGPLPVSVDQLLPNFDPPIDPAILDRYEMIQPIPVHPRLGAWLIQGNPATAVDKTLDEQPTIGVGSYGMQGPYEDGESASDPTAVAALHFPASLEAAVKEAAIAYSSATGHSTTSFQDLAPYFKRPEDAQKVQQILNASTSTTGSP